ncbi:interferon gamma-related-like [Triplophysa rosa]|uniref:Interferon gamma n=1 Tax=Triplophysa rosa TaxID=992332 RepID=A0A9W7WB93_TRIRA|nr:interferon gamma-related-like [Triplophysa rosa]KAI7791733.1 interferon gamma [Triplophysa rosa]
MTRQKMDSWLHIMLMCGPLIVSLQVTDGSRLPRSRYDKNQLLNTNIHQLQLHYSTNGAEWVGRSVFTPFLDQLSSRGSCTCQSMMLEGMLNIYEEVFTDMLNKSEKKELKNSVKDIMTEVKKLRHKYREEHKLWRDLQDIHLTKVKNGTIQGAALNEFLMVFNRAYTEKH